MNVYIVIEGDGSLLPWEEGCASQVSDHAYLTYEKAKDHAEDIATYVDLVQRDEWTWTNEEESTYVIIKKLTIVD